MLTQVDIIIGRRIRRRRRLLGLTQQGLGQACGVSFQSMQKYEAANARISVATLWKVARALNVNVDYFFSGIADDALAQPQDLRRASDARAATDHALAA